MSSSSPNNKEISSLYKTLQLSTHNIGKALTCAICQSSYVDPVLLPCVHAYCRDCITQSFSISGNYCPTCKLPAKKRSLVDASLLEELTANYKTCIKDLGLAPIQFDADFVGMTQNPISNSILEEKDVELHLQVSSTWQQVLQQNGQGNEALRLQQDQVVAVDQRVLLMQQQQEQENSSDDEEEEEDGKLPAVNMENSSQEKEELENPSGEKTTAAANDTLDKNSSTSLASNSNVDSQGNAFVDAKSFQEDDDASSVASDETTLSTQQETIQDVTTLLQNQNLILSTPAAAGAGTKQTATTRPRDNTTIVNTTENDDTLNALVSKQTAASPTYKTTSSQSLARTQSESQAFYTAESEAENTQDDDTSLTAVPAEKTSETGVTHRQVEEKAASAEEQPPNETEAVPKQVVTVQEQPPTEKPQAMLNNNENQVASRHDEPARAALSRIDEEQEHQPTARVQEASLAPQVKGNQPVASVEAVASDEAPAAPQVAPSNQLAPKAPTARPTEEEPDANYYEEAKVDSPTQTNEEAPAPRVESVTHSNQCVWDAPSAPPEEEAPLPDNDDDELDDEVVEPASEEVSVQEGVGAGKPTGVESQPDSEPASHSPTTATEATRVEPPVHPAEDDDEPMPDVDSDPETEAAERTTQDEPMQLAESLLDEPQEAEATPPSCAAFAVGTIVQVESRCWPGINKQGGVGRVTKVHCEGGVVSYDVAYVLGGKEKKVEAVFVSEQEPERERNRSPKSNEKAKLSPQLLASLAADGFDTEGKVEFQQQVRRVGVKAGTKRKALGEENNGNKPAAAQGLKKQKRSRGKAAAEEKTRRKRKEGATKSPPLPTLTDEQKREFADSQYEERFRTAESQSVISIVASSLAEHDMTMLQLLCKETRNHAVKVRTTETFNANKTTLVVVALDAKSTSENTTSRNRTLKVMRAMLAGIPIVSPSWVSSCLNEGKVILPTAEMYIRTVPIKTTDPAIHANLGASLLAARIHQSEGQGNARLLGNVRVLLCGQYNTSDGSPRKADIQTLLRESGATILTSVGGAMNKLKKIGDDGFKVVLLCDESPNNDRSGISTGLAKEAKTALQRNGDGVLVVNSTWLFDSISCGEMAPATPFKPKSARARELWKLCQ